MVGGGGGGCQPSNLRTGNSIVSVFSAEKWIFPRLSLESRRFWIFCMREKNRYELWLIHWAKQERCCSLLSVEQSKRDAALSYPLSKASEMPLSLICWAKQQDATLSYPLSKASEMPLSLIRWAKQARCALSDPLSKAREMQHSLIRWANQERCHSLWSVEQIKRDAPISDPLSKSTEMPLSLIRWAKQDRCRSLWFVEQSKIDAALSDPLSKAREMPISLIRWANQERCPIYRIILTSKNDKEFKIQVFSKERHLYLHTKRGRRNRIGAKCPSR